MALADYLAEVSNDDLADELKARGYLVYVDHGEMGMNFDWKYKWDLRFMQLAQMVASWSKDPSTKVGAVIVDQNNIVQGMGYNGFPRGVDDSDERLNDREWKYPLVVHAEANAILNAGHRAKGSRIYVWPTLMMPAACPECAKLISQSGLREVIYFEQNDAIKNDPKRNTEFWMKQAKFTATILNEAGVRTRSIPEPDTGPVF